VQTGCGSCHVSLRPDVRVTSFVVLSDGTVPKIALTVRSKFLVDFLPLFIYFTITFLPHTLSSLIFFDDHATFSQRKKERTDNDIILVHP